MGEFAPYGTLLKLKVFKNSMQRPFAAHHGGATLLGLARLLDGTCSRK